MCHKMYKSMFSVKKKCRNNENILYTGSRKFSDTLPVIKGNALDLILTYFYWSKCNEINIHHACRSMFPIENGM